jgi:hypothetical protein
MIYSTFASDLLPCASTVAETSILWLGGVLLASHLCVLGIATSGMLRSWRKRAAVQ